MSLDFVVNRIAQLLATISMREYYWYPSPKIGRIIHTVFQIKNLLR
jgi:hypothetical protein